MLHDHSYQHDIHVWEFGEEFASFKLVDTLDHCVVYKCGQSRLLGCVRGIPGSTRSAAFAIMTFQGAYLTAPSLSLPPARCFQDTSNPRRPRRRLSRCGGRFIGAGRGIPGSMRRAISARWCSEDAGAARAVPTRGTCYAFAILPSKART